MTTCFQHDGALRIRVGPTTIADADTDNIGNSRIHLNRSIHDRPINSNTKRSDDGDATQSPPLVYDPASTSKATQRATMATAATATALSSTKHAHAGTPGRQSASRAQGE